MKSKEGKTNDEVKEEKELIDKYTAKRRAFGLD